MEIIKMFSEPVSKKAQSLLQAYRRANDLVANAEGLDDKISAYNEVVDVCMSQKSCKYDDSIKRNKILYWAYNNVADSLSQKKEYREAIESYKKALQVAKDEQEKIEVLEKKAFIYSEMRDFDNWFRIKQGIIGYMGPAEKRKAYVQLADEINNDEVSANVLESALDFVMEEDTSAYNKCQNAIEVCDRLIAVYESSADEARLKRVSDLRNKMTMLLEKAGE